MRLYGSQTLVLEQHDQQQVQSTKILAGRYASACASLIGGTQGAGQRCRAIHVSHHGVHQCIAAAVLEPHGYAVSGNDPSLTFKNSPIRRVLVNVESSHLLDSEKWIFKTGQ